MLSYIIDTCLGIEPVLAVIQDPGCFELLDALEFH